MALSPRLELRTSQTLVMTPQLQQAIKLLQMSNLDLSQFVEQEVEKNPLLEIADGEAPADGGGASGDDWSGEDEPLRPQAETSSQTVDQSLNNDFDASTGDNAPLDADFDNVFDKDVAQAGPEDGPSLGGTYGAGAAPSGGTGNVLEETLSETPSLRAYLEEQLAGAVPTARHRMIALYIIDFINDAGYLTESIENICERLGAERGIVEETLAIVQACDPVGVGARDVAECLALQLKEKDRFDPAMAALVDNLDLLARQDFPGLMRICNVDREDLMDMLVEIRALNPKPGSAFGGEAVQTLVPDVFVRPASDGGWAIEINSETVPRVLINSRYYATVRKTASGRDEKTYLSDCLQSANWLVKALDQRARTILKVSAEIVRLQDAFLRHGISHLRPLNLRMVAEAISMHESTVSRVTANKYMATPRGVFELRYFFSSAVGTGEDGDGHSAEAVRHRIRQLIDEEPPHKILSDDKLVDLLQAEGIEVARRTVAKYRESMNIPSSVQRRRLKRVLAL